MATGDKGSIASTTFTDSTTPNIVSVVPNSAYVGETVVINLNKPAYSISSVRFGTSVTASSVTFPTVSDYTKISVVVPSGTGSNLDVYVSGSETDANHTVFTNISKNNAFNYLTCSNPTISTSGNINAVTYSGVAQTTTLPYTASTGSATTYSIDWDATANTAGLTDQSTTNYTFLAAGGDCSKYSCASLLISRNIFWCNDYCKCRRMLRIAKREFKL